jgi:hypothetical protein
MPRPSLPALAARVTRLTAGMTDCPSVGTGSLFPIHSAFSLLQIRFIVGCPSLLSNSSGEFGMAPTCACVTAMVCRLLSCESARFAEC